MAVEEKWYFTKEQLENSPSRKCDIDCDKELSYRQQAANFIQDMGQRLQVTQLCINTAIVYMHRFYVFHSFTHFHRYSMAAAALFLAAKVEEQPRKLEHVIKVAHLCLHREAGGPPPPPPPDVKSEQYAELAHDLVFNENVLLQTLGFDVAIDHPHTHVVRCCHLVKASKDLAQTSYFLASNSLHLTTMCLKYKPTVVACFCIHLACKWSNWEIPNSSEGKQWFLYVDSSVTSKLLEELTEEFIQIYNKCPSRLKKKIMSMSANQQCPSGHNPPTNNSNPMTNSVSPLTSEPRKIQTPPVNRDGVPHHSKVHYGEQKPSVPSQHRPSHENQNLNYLERKERERMEQKQLINQHHKPSLSVKQVQPSTSSKQHHRSNSGGIDPKLKVPQHSNPSVSRPLSSTSRADPHQIHQRTGEQQYSGTKDINQHRDLNRNSSDLGREPGRDLGREYCRDPAREMNRGNQGNRDVTASREHFFGRDPGTKEQFNNGERDSKRERVSVSSDNLLQDKNRDSYVSGNSSSSNRVDQSNHNVNRESAYRAYQIGREINKSRLDIANNDSLINDINRDNNERLRFEQTRGTKSSLTSNDISKLSGNNLQSNESKYDDPNRGGRELSESYSNAPKLYPKQLPYADVAKNKTQNVDKLYVGKSNSFRTINMEGHEDGNVGLTSSYRQQKPKLPQSSGGSNLPIIENKTSLVSIQSGPQYSSQSSLNKNDRSRNGSKTSLEEESYVRKKDVESSESNHSTTRPFLQTPPPKQKSIFSPVKEISPPKANSLQLSKRSKNKTSPSNSKRLIETPRLPSGLGIVPSPISPFGSPPAPAVTPNKNFNSKNRNRTSSSSSEPELVPVLKKLEEMSGFENIITDSKIKLRVPDIVQLIKDVKPLESESSSPSSCTGKTSSVREQKPAESVKPSLQIKADLTHKIDPPVSPTSRHCLTSNESTMNGVETKQISINDVTKGTVSTNHISATVDPTSDQFVVPLIDDSTLLRETASLQNVAPNLEENKLEHHHKSEKKKKKDKHKHKDKDRTREDKEKKKKHKDKDRDKHKEKLTLFEFESIVAPLKITIPKDKITPISAENPTGLKIKIPKERLKTTANTSPSGGLKIKISKDKIETLSAASENNRKRERDDQTARTGPPTKTAKVSYSRPSEADRQNGRNSYNSKQVLLGEGAQVGAMAQQWSKLAESKYHSKTAGATSGNRPPTS